MPSLVERLSGSGEEDFLNFVNVFSLFCNYLPLEKGGALHLNKPESPLPKDAMCKSLFELGPVVVEKSIF